MDSTHLDDPVVLGRQPRVPVDLGEIQPEHTAALLHRHVVVLLPRQQFQAEVPEGVVDGVALVDDGPGGGELEEGLANDRLVRFVMFPQIEMNDVTNS